MLGQTGIIKPAVLPDREFIELVRAEYPVIVDTTMPIPYSDTVRISVPIDSPLLQPETEWHAPMLWPSEAQRTDPLPREITPPAPAVPQWAWYAGGAALLAIVLVGMR